MKIEKTCPSCGRKSEIEVTSQEFRQYKEGKPINEFTYERLVREQRELLRSGLCLECQTLIRDMDGESL